MIPHYSLARSGVWVTANTTVSLNPESAVNHAYPLSARSCCISSFPERERNITLFNKQ